MGSRVLDKIYGNRGNLALGLRLYYGGCSLEENGEWNLWHEYHSLQHDEKLDQNIIIQDIENYEWQEKKRQWQQR